MRNYSYENYEHLIVPTIHGQVQTDWFKNQTAAWNTLYTPKFAEILTTRGYGFTFNILEAKDLLNVDELRISSKLSKSINSKIYFAGYQKTSFMI